MGGVCILPNWDMFTQENIDPYRIGNDGYGFMIDAQGNIIAHAVDKKLLGKSLAQSDFTQWALKEKKGVFPYEWEGRQKLLACDTDQQTGWVIMMSAYEDDLAQTAISQRNGLIIGGVCVVLIVIAILLLLLRNIVLTPIHGIMDYAAKVAHGDFNAKLPKAYKYEFKILSDEILVMVAELKNKLGFAEGVLNGIAIPSAIVGPDFKYSG